MAKRAHIALKIQLAAALVQIGEIPYEHAKAMSPDQIISLFALDHGIFHAWGGADEHWNLRFRLRREHIEKTKTDVGIIAKARRLTKAQEEFRSRLMASKLADANPLFEHLKKRSSIPSRPFQKGHRPLKSRNTLKRRVPA